jgi:hypothetical protein
MRLGSAVTNATWAAAAVPAWRRYRAALRQPLRSQALLLSDCLRANEDTEIGRELGFRDIRIDATSRFADHGACAELVERYRSRVPLVRYDALEPRVAKIRSGAARVLTHDSVRRLTPSSGSTAAAKLLPYTASLGREFARAVDAWLADLFLQTPALLGGRAYWSISPAIASDSSGAVPIGFEEDTEYLGGVRSRLARAVLAVPTGVCRITDVETFKYVTLRFLVQARDLRLISVWHPSFFSSLLDAMPAWFDRLIVDVGRGTITPPGDVSNEVVGSLIDPVREDPRRARELRAAGPQPRQLWPSLALVSCWAHGAAEPYAVELASRLSGVRVQPKGLIATEGIVSIPFGGKHPLACASHFFEFIDAAGSVRRADELRSGCHYSVVMTTGGGLYRYQLGDRVLVDGWVEATPSIRFVARDDRVSDCFGEKLSEGFVATALQSIFAPRPAPGFSMIAPERYGDGIAYTLFVDGESIGADLAARLEAELRRNPHYGWCVDLGQLKPARVAPVRPGADRLYVDHCISRGQRLGDVKPCALHPDLGWTRVLCPPSQ